MGRRGPGSILVVGCLGLALAGCGDSRKECPAGQPVAGSSCSAQSTTCKYKAPCPPGSSIDGLPVTEDDILCACHTSGWFCQQVIDFCGGPLRQRDTGPKDGGPKDGRKDGVRDARDLTKTPG